MQIPVIDLHCDLLSYLQAYPDAEATNYDAIGCSLPALLQGNVKIQVMAMYSSTEIGSTKVVNDQLELFGKLPEKFPDFLLAHENKTVWQQVLVNSKIKMLAAIENASGFCEEKEDLKHGFKRLDHITTATDGILYIGLTHHGENRFGGGNSTSVGLKEDGRRLLDYIHSRNIAIDFSHTSDYLAEDILNFITQRNLEIPVLASHSNFRTIFDHPRNLSDEFAAEIIKRNGIIGMNFLRAFLNDRNPRALFDHIQYGFETFGEKALSFGADFFYTESHPDKSRIPFFYEEQKNASCYPKLLGQANEFLPDSVLQRLAYLNAQDFIQKVLSSQP